MIKPWKLYNIRLMEFNYNNNVRYIDNLGFELTPQDLTNIKIHKRRVIHGLEFQYIAPDVVISIGKQRCVVATYTEDINTWYMFKWDERTDNIKVVKVL